MHLTPSNQVSLGVQEPGQEKQTNQNPQWTNKVADKDFLYSGGGGHWCDQSWAGMKTVRDQGITKEAKLKVTANKTDFKINQEILRTGQRLLKDNWSESYLYCCHSFRAVHTIFFSFWPLCYCCLTELSTHTQFESSSEVSQSVCDLLRWCIKCAQCNVKIILRVSTRTDTAGFSLNLLLLPSPFCFGEHGSNSGLPAGWQQQGTN